MKLPLTPPNASEIVRELFTRDNVEKAYDLIINTKTTNKKGQYLHWDQLRHRDAPEGFTSEEWWAVIKYARRTQYKKLNLLLNKNSEPFNFSIPDCVLEDLHYIDLQTAGQMSTQTPIVNPHMKNTYLVRSFIEEAISSSQLEGAVTTQRIAKEMLRQGRKPKNKSERMIFNNYQAMQFINEQKGESLTPSMVFELHRILTDKTLDDPGLAGRFRTEQSDIHIIDSSDNVVLHVPPKVGELPDRMKKLCQFANEKKSEHFIHPVIRAIILHFMLAYDHPFIDGNGRTARALFYWSVINHGYWVMEFFSISKIIKESQGQYKKAFLFTESDENDLTYFIFNQLKVLKKAYSDLWSYLDKKSKEILEAEKLLESTASLRGKLNFRQLSLLRHALKHPGHVYSIQEHQRIHGISYETSRKDLLFMSENMNMLTKFTRGKAFMFSTPDDLNKRLDKAK